MINARDELFPFLERLESKITYKHMHRSTGFNDLDVFVGNWEGTMVLSAVPNMGLRTLFVNLISNLLRDVHCKIHVLGIEPKLVIKRLVARESRVDSAELRRGKLGTDEQERMMQGTRKVNEYGPRLTFGEDVSDEAELIFVMTQDIEEVKRLKKLYPESDIVVGTYCDSKKVSAKVDKRPHLRDMSDEWAILADQMLFLYRDDFYNPDSEVAGMAEIIVAKNSLGDAGSLFLAWQPNYSSFFNLIEE